MRNDEILTVKETADLLKTTRQQVRKMIANEELPAFWSVGCLAHKSEPVLGQKWVRISSQAVFKAGISFSSVSHTEGMSIAP